MVTTVIGYSELALHAIEDSHPAREWLEKIRSQTKQLASFVRKFMDLNRNHNMVSKHECRARTPRRIA